MARFPILISYPKNWYPLDKMNCCYGLLGFGILRRSTDQIPVVVSSRDIAYMDVSAYERQGASFMTLHSVNNKGV